MFNLPSQITSANRQFSVDLNVYETVCAAKQIQRYNKK